MRIAIVLGCLALTAAAANATDAKVTEARVVLVGDSTMASLSGYGDALCARFAPDDITCLNMARGGRSSLSYRAEGLWDAVQTLIAKPPFTRSYVLIQFGHNDQPGKPGRSTTIEEFEANMTRYVREAREVGAVPVLVTPLSRRQFQEGKVVRNLEQWAEVTRRVAKASDTLLLDLNRDSVAALDSMGSTEANTLARGEPPAEVIAASARGTTIPAPKTDGPVRDEFDYTHLGPKGAEFFASMVAREIRDTVPWLQRRIRE